MRIWRRLQQLGAVAIKHAAYVLPDTAAARQRFADLRQEIEKAGGASLLLRATGFDVADAEIEALFRAERSAAYRKLLDDIGATLDVLRKEQLSADELREAEERLWGLEVRLLRIREHDYFPGPLAAEAEALLQRTRLRLRAQLTPRATTVLPRPIRSGVAWSSYKGLSMDGLASAWIIRRFVDTTARFVFLKPDEELAEDAIPFGIPGTSFGPTGASTACEAIAAYFAGEDAALDAVVQVIRGIEVGDPEANRPECAGIERQLSGICALSGDDHERISLSRPLLDALYGGFRQSPSD